MSDCNIPDCDGNHAETRTKDPVRDGYMATKEREVMTADRVSFRIRCRLTGCDGSPFCERCGTDLYDPTYLQFGHLEPLLTFWWRVRRVFVKDRRCGAPVTAESTCLRVKGHTGDCDDIPF